MEQKNRFKHFRKIKKIILNLVLDLNNGCLNNIVNIAPKHSTILYDETKPCANFQYAVSSSKKKI